MSETTDTKKPKAKVGEIRAKLVDHVEVTCEAVLGSGNISIGRLNAMTKGDVIALDRSPADPVEIRVNGKIIARGEIVTVDDSFAVRLTEIG
ncbi:FliM/FliN family flagellar motor switch protein [Qipengyuania sp. DGS5-3]|uniref:FliM/FliN family flagellar motor switch protein n=1 Tax=Qipengyuania sp. DGS5-3 TaxID=3349632 RepID=UPI0036D28FC5